MTGNDGRDTVPDEHGKSRGTVERLAWFAGLWVAGVTVVAAVAFAIRLVLT